MRRISLLLVDLILILSGTFLALLLRDNFDVTAAELVALQPYLFSTVLTALIVLSLLGIDRAIWRFSVLADYIRVFFAAIVIVIGAVALTSLYNRFEGIARSLPLLQLLTTTFALVGARVLMRLRHKKRAVPAQPMSLADGSREMILILGLTDLTELYLRAVAQLARDRIGIAGLVGRAPQHRGRLMQTYPILGVPEEIGNIVDTLRVHGVFVDRIVVMTGLEKLSPEARAALRTLELTSSVRLDVFADRLLPLPAQAGTRTPPGPPTLAAMTSVASHTTLPAAAPATAGNGRPRSQVFAIGEPQRLAMARRPYWACKRLIDIAGAGTLLLILTPVMMVLAILVAIDVGLPILFWQQRPGRGGRPFKLFKVRTMASAHDAEGRRAPDAQRLSAIGRMIRHSRLDELPQLCSIVAGDMSFVGPRPLLPVDQDAAFAARLLVRPGLTGWAQVIGGRSVSALDKAALDVWYIRNASLRLDLEIMARTVPMIIFGEKMDLAAIRRAWHDLRREGICAGEPQGAGESIAESRTTSIPAVMAHLDAVTAVTHLLH